MTFGDDAPTWIGGMESDNDSGSDWISLDRVDFQTYAILIF